MFDTLREIGEAVLSSGYEFGIKGVKSGKNLLAKVIFDLDSGKLECDCSIKCEGREGEYLWVGNAIGQKPQMVLTTDDPKYLLDSSKPKKWAIGRLASEAKRFDEEVRKLGLILSEVEEKFFSTKKSYVDDFKALLDEKGCTREVALYTACVKRDGKIIDLVKEPGYRKLLDYVLYATESEKYPALPGVCHVCGKEKKVLTNPSYPEGTILCIYNVDKAGFMPGLSRKPEDMLKAHAVCHDCRKKLMLGLNFIEGNLTGTIGKASTGRLNVFLIPKVLGAHLSYELLKRVASKVSGAFNAVRTYKSLEEVEGLMSAFMEFEEAYGSPSVYFLHILFGYRVQSQFSFQRLIQDVPVMRLVELARAMTEASNDTAEIFNEKRERWSIGFEDVFSIFPLRKTRLTLDWKPLVELFNSMLTGSSYPKENIIAKAVLFARINRHETYEGFNIERPKNVDEWLCRGILKYNLLLNLLAKRRVIEVERERVADPFKVPDEDIEGFFSRMNYVEWQKALFLLGVLIGKVGVEQYKKDDKKKAILNKINFEGMPVERVKLLANHVLEGLRNYRVLDSRNEMVYAYMKMMMDRNLEALRNPVDNVFYILSGYAYATLQAITGGGEKDEQVGTSE